MYLARIESQWERFWNPPGINGYQWETLDILSGAAYCSLISASFLTYIYLATVDLR